MKLEKKTKPYFGSHRYSPAKVIRELAEHPRVLEALKKYPPEKSWSRFSRNPVQEYLKEIVATPSIPVTNGYRHTLKLLWYRIFNGLEIQGLERLKEQIEGKQVVYLPCHRSHLDYLLLSYVLDQHYMEIPHIIAGNNLNLTGLGKILKCGGAIFMRRIMRDQPLYATVFVTYLNYLLDNGVPLEIFIEGGRSRTGKNLPPRIGLLSILLEYLMQNTERDLYFIPTSFTYERIPEETSYIRELNGSEKQQESLLDLMNSFKVLKKNFGKVFVSFAPAMSVRQIMADYQKHNGLQNLPFPDTSEFKEMAYSIGMDVMDQINTHTRTSALPVVATALLAEKHQGFHKTDLLEKSQFLVDVYQAVHPRAQDTLVEREGGLEGVVDFLIQGGTVNCMSDPDEDIYYFNPEDKVRLNLYKNIFVHHFVIPSIIALKLKHGVQTRKSLLEQILFFDDLLRYEFMFPKSYDFIEAVDTMLNFAMAQGLIVENKGKFSVNPQKLKQIDILANILLPFLDSFRVAINVLTSKKAAFPLDSKKLLTVFRETHQKLLLLGEIDSLEGNLTVTYKSIIRFFTEEKILSSTKSEKKKTILRKGDESDKIFELKKQLFPPDAD